MSDIYVRIKISNFFFYSVCQSTGSYLFYLCMFLPLSICAFFTLGFFLYSRIYRVVSIDNMKAILNLLGVALYLLCIFKCYRSPLEKLGFIFAKS